MSSADVAEPQVLVGHDGLAGPEWHHRILLRRLDRAQWIVVDPSGAPAKGETSKSEPKSEADAAAELEHELTLHRNAGAHGPRSHAVAPATVRELALLPRMAQPPPAPHTASNT